MRAAIVLILSSLAVLGPAAVLAQNATLPDCEQGCADSALSNSGCSSFNDTDCICTGGTCANFNIFWGRCVGDVPSCTTDDYNAALAWHDDLCAGHTPDCES
ncbi:uncharacterized protein STEHIDRAFT_149191 [Stereum hirsutum FP-91666 SS1]|uniref:uncharacterized protein n=1 Tax=Stereum hirsutum (strain FP-91666) TaxID=721885 RepID=UPI000444A706|nr:uncharacterized protein STEHIDRAFT_149191 [Stereum hirsutum FP-91666 SS1]EIM82806.1 hypothetical protein STEHIDRAFT_149191 [Stereum hirsutum FP-91666 SS1]